MGNYKEVIIVVVAGILIFFVLVGILIYIIVFYQKKRLLHQQQIFEIERSANDALLKSGLEVQEKTMDYISKEIHDNVGQILSFAAIQLNLLDRDNHPDHAVISEVKQTIRSAMDELRLLSRNLNTTRFHGIPLSKIITDEVDRLSKSGIIEAQINVEGTERILPGPRIIIIFRVIQEALHNIIKHANASFLEVNMSYDDRHISIAVTDNGRGFDTSQSPSGQGGQGLSNIRERAAILNGVADISSDVGTGTKVSITIPYE